MSPPAHLLQVGRGQGLVQVNAILAEDRQVEPAVMVAQACADKHIPDRCALAAEAPSRARVDQQVRLERLL